MLIDNSMLAFPWDGRAARSWNVAIRMRRSQFRRSDDQRRSAFVCIAAWAVRTPLGASPVDFFATLVSPELAVAKAIAVETTELFASSPGIAPQWRIIRLPLADAMRRNLPAAKQLRKGDSPQGGRIFRHAAH